MEEFTLVKDLALIMITAGVVTFVFRNFKLSPLFGYLVAGFLAFYMFDLNILLRLLIVAGFVFLILSNKNLRKDLNSMRKNLDS